LSNRRIKTCQPPDIGVRRDVAFLSGSLQPLLDRLGSARTEGLRIGRPLRGAGPDVSAFPSPQFRKTKPRPV